MPLFRFSRQIGTRVLPPFFRAPCVCCSVLANLLLFSNIFVELSVFSVTKMKSNILYARAQAAILGSLGHSVKEIAKCFKVAQDSFQHFLRRRF